MSEVFNFADTESVTRIDGTPGTAYAKPLELQQTGGLFTRVYFKYNCGDNGSGSHDSIKFKFSEDTGFHDLPYPSGEHSITAVVPSEFVIWHLGYAGSVTEYDNNTPTVEIFELCDNS